MTRSATLTVLGMAVLVIGACAAPVTEQEHMSFISDYSLLEKSDENAYRYTSPKMMEYSIFMIEGPTMLFERETADGERRFTDEDLEELSAYFRAHLETTLTDDGGYRVVNEPGQGVAKIRIGITALDATVGALNITVYTKITGAGLGGVAMEGEIVDSISGEQLAAWGNGSRILRAGLTKLGDAKLRVNRWTKDLRKRIDAAHNGTTGSSSPE